MYSSTLLNSFFQDTLQPVKRCSLRDTNLLAFLSQQWLRPHPDNIIYCQIFAEDILFVLIDVDNGSEAGEIEAEKIKKRTVLPEGILIVRVIHWRLFIAQKQNYPGANLLP